jgi:5-enolpyruvylshikimate-3-phosphate synthase
MPTKRLRTAAGGRRFTAWPGIAIRVLIELGATKRLRSTTGRYRFTSRPDMAEKDGQEAAVRALIELGADKEAKDKDNRTPLHVAARFGKEAVNYTDAGKTLGGVRG